MSIHDNKLITQLDQMLYKDEYTLKEASYILGKSHQTLWRWCKTNHISYIPKSQGSKPVYYLHRQTIIDLVKKKSLPTIKEEGSWKSHIDYWETLVTQGLKITSRPYSQRTFDDYKYYLDKLLKLPQGSYFDAYLAGLKDIPIEHDSTREHYYKAALSYAKALVEIGCISKLTLEQIKEYKPTRKQGMIVKPAIYNDVVKVREWSKKNDEVCYFIVMMLLNTGMRVSELVHLKRSDINLDEGSVTIKKSKWGKTRRVGITIELMEYLRGYTGELYTCYMSRRGINRRLEKASRHCGLTYNVSPHQIRRVFVTENHKQGKPLVVLQRACGHSSIEVTRGYCKITEEDVVKGMSEW